MKMSKTTKLLTAPTAITVVFPAFAVVPLQTVIFPKKYSLLEKNSYVPYFFYDL